MAMLSFNYGPFSKKLAADAGKIKFTYLLYILTIKSRNELLHVMASVSALGSTV